VVILSSRINSIFEPSMAQNKRVIIASEPILFRFAINSDAQHFWREMEKKRKDNDTRMKQ